MTILGNASWIITMDSSERVIRDGAILVDGDSIIEVGKTDEVKRNNPSAEFIEHAKIPPVDFSELLIPYDAIQFIFHQKSKMRMGMGTRPLVSLYYFDFRSQLSRNGSSAPHSILGRND